MQNLDLSQLSADQLLTLIRAACREVADRTPAVRAAAEAVILDEGEKVQIQKEAAEREAAKLRAAARERVAKEAANEVRRKAAAAERETEALRNRKAGERAAEKVERAEAEQKAWLRRAGALLGAAPGEISIVYVDTRYGVRVLINPNTNRYSSDHLVDWNVDGKIKTKRHLVTLKPELAAFCAEFREAYRSAGYLALTGDEFDWPKNQTAN